MTRATCRNIFRGIGNRGIYFFSRSTFGPSRPAPQDGGKLWTPRHLQVLGLHTKGHTTEFATWSFGQLLSTKVAPPQATLKGVPPLSRVVVLASAIVKPWKGRLAQNRRNLPHRVIASRGLNDECIEVVRRKVIVGHMLLNSGWDVHAGSAMRLFIKSAVFFGAWKSQVLRSAYRSKRFRSSAFRRPRILCAAWHIADHFPSPSFILSTRMCAGSAWIRWRAVSATAPKKAAPRRIGPRSSVCRKAIGELE